LIITKHVKIILIKYTKLNKYFYYYIIYYKEQMSYQYPNINYYVPQLEDTNYLVNGLNLLYMVRRSYLMERKYLEHRKALKNINVTESDIVKNIIADDKSLIKKFDDNNYLTTNSFPYSNPLLCNHLIFWTLNNKTHRDVLTELVKINLINPETEYLIWQNSPKAQSIKTIKHYQILLRPKIFKSIGIQPNQPNQVDTPNTQRKLRKIIIVARHGPREPIHPLSKLKKFDPNNLTKLDNDISSDSDSLVSSESSVNSTSSANSTKSIKTTESAESYAKNVKKVKDAKLTPQGLKFCYNYGEYIRKLFDPYLVFDPTLTSGKTVVLSTNVNRTINSAIQFMNGLCKMDGITSYTEKDIVLSDDLLGDINMNEEMRAEYNDYHDKIVISNANKEFDNKLYQILGAKVNGVKDYFNIHSTIKVYQFHNQDLPKEWTPELNNQLNECAAEYYYKLFSGNKKIFRNRFTDKLLDKVATIIADKDINFAYLSTHDVVIYPLALRIAGEQVHMPDFCASVRFEIWDREMRIYYDDVLICNKLLD